MEKDPYSIAPGDRTIVLTPGAQRNLENMQQRVWDIANTYGLNSVDYQKALLSFQQCIMQMLRFGGKVYGEDDLSLIVESYITLGIIFHRTKYKHEDGGWDADPLKGEWSTHS